ncbi:DUF2163 domain-containing protein [Croceicoccus gelatinilyticus]|uniref:DUF2163 domain-containing protein n=1 Tax=Croceicoccus gelatinilyticus TaxID=2835536 RepID=UPI001BCEB1D3|nr:DUF2163 domain-containing protein [Croceicoccus gelatinilyticus]
MTRTVPALLSDVIAQSPRKGAECVVLQPRNGDRVALTTWNRTLTIDLGTGEDPDVASPGMVASAVTMALGMESSNFELSGPVGGEFTAERVRGHYWQNAKVWLAWTSPGVAETLPVVPILCGRVADCRIEGGKWILQVRDHADALNQVIGRVQSPYCTYDFGDGKCTATRTPYPCTVTAVTSTFEFTVDEDGEADNFFDGGDVTFLTGALAGIEAEVFRYEGGALELFAALPAAPEVGDTLNLFRGCSKLRKSDDETLPTCLTYDNVINFGGHPEVPGTEKYMKIATPGSGGGRQFAGGTLVGGSEGGLTPP